MKTWKHQLVYFLLFLSAIIYFWIAYFTKREDFTPFILLTSFAFVSYLFASFSKWKITNLKHILVIGIGLRLVFLFSIPELSDDYHRFFWDGNLIEQGINPYLETPTELANTVDFENSTEMTAYLVAMNSPNYYSVYPPLSQFSYTAATFIAKLVHSNPIVIYRILILLTELAIFALLLIILKFYNLPLERIAVYFFNPLVILEFTGNLHGEIFVIAFLLSTLVLLMKNKWQLAAITLGCAISFKLTPLIFLPLLINYLGFKKGILFSTIATGIFILTFLPFINATFINHIADSIGLYFKNFEFNSSFYHLFQFFNKLVSNPINTAFIGKLMGILTFLSILYLSFRPISKDLRALIQRIALLLIVYLLLAQVVHPWYITPLIALAVFINNKVTIAWSFLILLTYFTYSVQPYSQNGWLIFVEYFGISAVAFFQWRNKLVMN